MQFNIESIGAVKKRINVDIPADTVTAEIDAAYGKLRNQVKMDGFRKGKVPRSLLEKYYKGHVEHDVTSKLISESLNKVISENEIFPVSEPEVEAQPLMPGSAFNYTATVEIRPDVDVNGYEGLRIEKEKVLVTDGMVDERLEVLRKQNLVMNDVERALSDGDTAVIDFEGFVGETPIKDGKGEEMPLKIGSGRFIPGFEEQLVGMSAGEEKDINVKFPLDYPQKELAGRDATFKVRVKGVQEEILPEVDDELAKDMGYGTLDELKTHIKDIIEREKTGEVKKKMRDRIINALIDINPFEVPQSMVDKQVDYLMEGLKRKYEKAGIDIHKELETGELMNSLEKTAVTAIRGAMILTAIAKKEGIKIDDKDIEERFNLLASEARIDVTVLRSYYEKNGLIEGLRREILEDKVFDTIISKANVVEIL